MKYIFTDQDIKTIDMLNLPFTADKNLTDDEELALLEALLDRFGTDSKESFESVYQTMTEQAQ